MLTALMFLCAQCKDTESACAKLLTTSETNGTKKKSTRTDSRLGKGRILLCDSASERRPAPTKGIATFEG